MFKKCKIKFIICTFEGISKILWIHLIWKHCRVPHIWKKMAKSKQENEDTSELLGLCSNFVLKSQENHWNSFVVKIFFEVLRTVCWPTDAYTTGRQRGPQTVFRAGQSSIAYQLVAGSARVRHGLAETEWICSCASCSLCVQNLSRIPAFNTWNPTDMV